MFNNDVLIVGLKYVMKMSHAPEGVSALYVGHKFFIAFRDAIYCNKLRSNPDHIGPAPKTTSCLTPLSLDKLVVS